MFGRTFSREGTLAERDWNFTKRRINDDVARNQHRLTGECVSILEEAKVGEEFLLMLSPELSNDGLLRNRK